METTIEGKKRIGGYLRVSTMEQAKEGFGLKTQRHHIVALVDANAYQGWVLAEIYQDDGVSGSLASRPALDRLIENAKNGKIDMVVVWKIDRLFRNMRHLLETVELLGTYGVDFKSVTEPFDTSAVGQFIFQIFGALAEFERNLIRMRTTEGKMSAVRDGYYVGTNIPYGYQVVGEPKRRKLVLLPAEAKWVRKIFDWFVISRWTPEDIAAELTKRGVPGKKDGKKSKSGKPSRKTNPPCYWNGNSIRNILQATNYIGYYNFGSHTRNKNGECVETPQGDWIAGKCAALFEKPNEVALYAKAQKRLKASNRHANGAKNLYLLSGRIRCGGCGSSLTGYVSMKKTKNYRCIKNNKTKSSFHCLAGGTSELKVTAPVWELVQTCLLKPESVFRQIEREMRQTVLHASLQKQKADLLLQKDRGLKARQDTRDLLREGILTKDEAKTDLQKNDSKIQQITDDLAAVESQLTMHADKEDKIEALRQMRKKYQRNLKNLTYEDKYTILQALVRRVTLHGEDLKIELRVPKTVQKELAKPTYGDGDPGGNRTCIYPLGEGRSIH